MNFRSKKQGAELPTFQITPMLDVVFLLLCFFVTAQVFSQWESEIGIQLPTSDSRRTLGRLPGEVILNIREDGAIIVYQRQRDDAELAALLNDLATNFPGDPIVLRADRRVSYEHVFRVLDLCRQHGIWNVSFATAWGDDLAEAEAEAEAR